MAGLTSAIPDAITALIGHLAMIAATYTDPQLQVIDGDLGTNVLPAFVQIGNATGWVQEAVDLGNFRRDERFDLEGIIQWFDGGAGAEVASQVRADAFAILEAVVLAITADPTLGGSVMFAQCTGGGAMEQGTTANGGWSVIVPFQVHCQAQLQR